MGNDGDVLPFGPVHILAGLAGIPCFLLGRGPVRSTGEMNPTGPESKRSTSEIAHELGVTPEQFRAALDKVRTFSSVGTITDDQRRANRRALCEMLSLAPAQLDEVIDRRRSADEFRSSASFDVASGVPRPKSMSQFAPSRPKCEGSQSVEQIASALGVSAEQFREAFKQVRPVAPGERPTDEQRRANREMLSASLGVSSERLDEVMEKYRPVS